MELNDRKVDLCRRVLDHSMHSGHCDNSRMSEIKEKLLFFFPKDIIDRAVNIQMGNEDEVYERGLVRLMAEKSNFIFSCSKSRFHSVKTNLISMARKSFYVFAFDHSNDHYLNDINTDKIDVRWIYYDEAPQEFLVSLGTMFTISKTPLPFIVVDDCAYMIEVDNGANCSFNSPDIAKVLSTLVRKFI